jgi:hypothetical protein
VRIDDQSVGQPVPVRGQPGQLLRRARRPVVVVGDELPVIIGQVPLELMDWVVDPKGQRLVGNPEHGGEQMIDIL